MPDFEVFADRERSGWADKGIVESYISRFGPVTGQVATELLNRCHPNGTTVLDLCCGHGSLTRMLCDAGAAVSGLDFSDEMLRRARVRAPQADLRRGDASALPFDDGSFDLVVCNFGMMHLPDQPAALAEIRRVLLPGGRFLMATWAPPEVSPAFAAVFGAIKASADMSHAPPQPDLFAFARPETARDMMQAAGLALEEHALTVPAWELSRASELFDIFLNATVGAAMLIKSQRADVIAAMREQVTSTVEREFKHGDGYRVPVAVAIVTARRSALA